MTPDREHWSGPDSLIQKNTEQQRPVADNKTIIQILQAALDAIKNLENRQPISTQKEPKQHWSGPDDLLGH